MPIAPAGRREASPLPSTADAAVTPLRVPSRASSTQDTGAAPVHRTTDANLVEAAHNARPPAPNRGILYVGLNPESETIELAALRRTGKVRALVEPTSEGEVAMGGSRFDLSRRGQIEAFVRMLALDPRVAPGVEAALRAAESGSREKIAQIAVVFAEAERGTPIPSRLVISGHSGGLDVFGEHGWLVLADLQRLARAMPRAAANIEDIHFSACSTSGQAGVDGEREAWREVFPNLTTIWSYAGTAPLAPAHHLEAWGRATGRPHDSLRASASMGDERVATWSEKDGYVDRIPIARLRTAAAEADLRFDRFLAGELTASRGGAGAAPSYALADYQAYRVLSQKNEITSPARAELARKADQLLRIRYYEEGVRTEFAKRYADDVRRGFEAIGLRAPDFGAITRGESLARIASFEDKLGVTRPVPDSAARLAPLLRKLRDLDPQLIPASDCHH